MVMTMSYRKRPQYKLFAPDGTFVAPVTEHESAMIAHRWFETGTGTIVINGEPDSDIFMRALNVHEEPLLISVYDNTPRPWTGRVHDAEYIDDGDGPALELTLVNDRIWMDAILALQVPYGGINQSASEFDTRTGSLQAVVRGYIQDAVNRMRLPIIVNPVPTNDASPIIELSARMTSISELVDTALREYGYSLSVTMFREGDPFPDEMAEPMPGQLIVDILEPRDNAGLMWQQEQLVSFSLGSRESNAHTVWLGGDGQGTSRTYYQYEDTESKIRQNGYGLPEVYVDNTGTSSPALLGPRVLKEHAGGISVGFVVEDEHPWSFGTDWLPGDFAYARIAGTVWRAQILDVEMRETEESGVLYTPKCGTASAMVRDDRDVVTNAVARLVADLKTRRARV